MWSLCPTDLYGRRLNKYSKDRPKEMVFVLKNLQTYWTGLRDGVNPLQLCNHRFVHNEGSGIYAVDQKGAPKNGAEIRLYVFPDLANKTLYLLTIGDKNTQKRDIKDCQDITTEVRANARNHQSNQPQNSQKVPEPSRDDQRVDTG